VELEDKYYVNGINLFNIRNRNELRVIKAMQDLLDEHYEKDPDVIDIQDIYALALNKLPSRYIQQGGMVLKEPLSDAAIKEAVMEAINIVQSKPNY